jgi:hypothetical protein
LLTRDTNFMTSRPIYRCTLLSPVISLLSLRISEVESLLATLNITPWDVKKVTVFKITNLRENVLIVSIMLAHIVFVLLWGKLLRTFIL